MGLFGNNKLKGYNMLNTVTINTLNIEDFMSSFGITRLETQKDEGLLSKESCKQRILDLITLNIKNFRDNSWNKSNQMNKLLIDLDEKKNISVFSVRLGGKRIYRCSCPLFPTDQKIAFLTKFYEAVSKGILDTQIETFCENEVKLKEERRKANNKKKQDLRNERKLALLKAWEAEKQANEEAMKHLPQVA